METSTVLGRSRVAMWPWLAGASLLTVLLAYGLWRWWAASVPPLRGSGHIAAALGLAWAIVVWLARWALNERGRLTAFHPLIVIGQFMCLAACLYAVLIDAYFILPQFSLAIIQTWSYTLLSPAQWFFSDYTGLFDLACVAAVCLILTEATRSAYLMMPLFWTLFLAMVWACLLIPPVEPSFAVDEPGFRGFTGNPSLWALTLLVGSAVLLSVFVALQRRSWVSSRRRAWRLNSAYLLRPARTWPGLTESIVVVAFFMVIFGGLFIVFPAPAGFLRGALPALICAVAAAATGISTLAVVHRHWRTGLAEIGFGLLTLAVCTTALAAVPGNARSLSDQFPMIFNALVFGLAIAAAWWLWLGRVWHQQLHPDGTAWTTAGRLVAVARRSSFMAALLGVLFALHMALWPMRAEVRIEDNAPGRLVAGITGILLLSAVIVWAYMVTRRPVFRALLMLSSFSLLLFGLVRILPYTPLGL